MVTWHKSDGGKRSLVVINVYCPRADPERRDRLLYKMKFYKLLEMRADALLRAGHSVIIVGDVNTSHKQIDHCDPYEVRYVLCICACRIKWVKPDKAILVQCTPMPLFHRILRVNPDVSGWTTSYIRLGRTLGISQMK